MSEKTITQVMLEAQNRTQIATRFKQKKAWQSKSWRECYELADTIGSALISMGLKKGDRVAILSNTRYEWWLTDFGIMGAGFVTVPLYQSSRTDEVEYILNNSEAKVIFLEDASQVKKWESISRKCSSITKVVCFQNDSQLPDEILSWDQFLQEGEDFQGSSPNAYKEAVKAGTLKDVATILYTSGTTGVPKGVVLTHLQIISEVSEVQAVVGLDHRDESLSFLPYSHIMGRIESWLAVYAGFTLNFAESIERIRPNLAEIKPTIMIAVPRIFEKIYAGILGQVEANPTRNRIFQWALGIGRQVSNYQIKKQSVPVVLLAQYTLAKKLVFNKLKEKMGGRLRFAVSGGAPLSPDIAKFFHAADLLLLEGYGLTETTAAIAVNTPFDYQFGTVGKPVGDVKVKFAPDGEILIKSNKVMKEYYKDPKATEEAFEDGYFKTGDIGELTPDGFLKITDRKKDLIKTAGGKYVAPQRLENLLKLNRLVSNVLIHGDQRKYIVALITLNEEVAREYAKNADISYQGYAALTQHEFIQSKAREAVAETNAHLASFETIKNFAVLQKDFTIEDGELTPSLKVKRKHCDAKYKDVIEKLYD